MIERHTEAVTDRQTYGQAGSLQAGRDTDNKTQLITLIGKKEPWKDRLTQIVYRERETDRQTDRQTQTQSATHRHEENTTS